MHSIVIADLFRNPERRGVAMCNIVILDLIQNLGGEAHNLPSDA